MAPEAFRGDISPKMDVFSYGVVSSYILTCTNRPKKLFLILSLILIFTDYIGNPYGPSSF